MKKYIVLNFILLSFLISCHNNGGSTYAMKERYDKFIDILPKEEKSDFTMNSSIYSNEYANWQNDLYSWIDTTMKNEKLSEEDVKSRISEGKIEFNIETLLSREYERVLPYDLMKKVKIHTDKNLSPKIKELEKDEAFSNKLNKLKKDEAIENFATDDVVFYYTWNYLLGLNRPRRFQ